VIDRVATVSSDWSGSSTFTAIGSADLAGVTDGEGWARLESTTGTMGATGSPPPVTCFSSPESIETVLLSLPAEFRCKELTLAVRVC
jgi:hypothetical protein